MPSNEPRKASGEATSSVSRKAGTPKRTTKASGKAVAKADLDVRHERITRPRRAMGPPLGSTSAAKAAAPPRGRREDVGPTDPVKSAKSTAKKSAARKRA
jgi:hypothetical protein